MRHLWLEQRGHSKQDLHFPIVQPLPYTAEAMDTADPCQTTGHEPLTYDLQAVLGQPIKLIVDRASTGLLVWYSHDGSQTLAEGDFFQPPGLPLQQLQDTNGRTLEDLTEPAIRNIADHASPVAFEILQGASASAECRELAVSAPLLFTLLVYHAKKDQYEREAFANLCALRRHDALKELGLPSKRSIPRLLARTGMGPVSLELLRVMPTLVADESLMQVLRHTPDLHTNHFEFLRRSRIQPWPGLLRLIDAESTRRHMSLTAMLARDTAAMIPHNDQRLTRISTFEALQTLHDQLVARINQEDEAEKAQRLENVHGIFPAQPVPGDSKILPLNAWMELVEEGKLMHHCVAIYAEDIAKGRVFVYRMEQPERLTIALEKRRGAWRLKEMKGRFNQPPSQGAADLVYQWLEQNRDNDQPRSKTIPE